MKEEITIFTLFNHHVKFNELVNEKDYVHIFYAGKRVAVLDKIKLRLFVGKKYEIPFNRIVGENNFIMLYYNQIHLATLNKVKCKLFTI